MGEMETQAVHELTTWNIMEDQVAENREARKRANQRRNTVQKEKDAGLDQIATIARTLVNLSTAIIPDDSRTQEAKQ